MGILGGAIGLGIGAVGSILGGIAGSRASKKVNENLQEQRRRNQDWYDRNYNEDATQRADAQAILSRTEEAIKARNRAAAGAAAVPGGTEESVAATKAANAQAMADATAQIAVNGERRKDAVDQRYQAKEDAIQSEMRDAERQKADEIGKATGQMMPAGMAIGGGL